MTENEESFYDVFLSKFLRKTFYFNGKELLRIFLLSKKIIIACKLKTSAILLDLFALLTFKELN